MDPHSGCGLPEQFMTHYSPVVTGAIKYKGRRRSGAISRI